MVILITLNKWTAMKPNDILKITQVCDQKTFLTRVAVSYAFFRADNGKNSEKVPSRTIFAQISIFDFGTQWITTGC